MDSVPGWALFWLDKLGVRCEPEVWGGATHQALGCLGGLVLCPEEASICKYCNALAQVCRHVLRASCVPRTVLCARRNSYEQGIAILLGILLSREETAMWKCQGD